MTMMMSVDVETNMHERVSFKKDKTHIENQQKQ